MEKNNKPKFFFALKLVGMVGVVLTVVSFVFIFTGFGDFESNKFMIGAFLAPVGLMVASVGLLMGFKPEIAKMTTKSTRYIQQENQEDLTAIASNTADIMGEAVTKTAQAVKQGLVDTMYCKHCGAQIASDSKFCKVCGKEQ